MKTRTILAGLISLAAGLAGASAQTAVTDPVGYITINVAAKPTGSALSPIAPTLVNKVEFSGALTAIDATTMTVSGTPFTAGAFNPVVVAPYTFNRFYVEVTSGAGEGAWTNITGNTANTITTEDSMTAFAGVGATIKIRAHVTVNQFFGATNSAGLKEGFDPGLADEVFFIDPSTVPVTAFYDSTGWVDADGLSIGQKPIEPQQGLLVKHKTSTAISFVNVGHVKTGKTMLGLVKGLNIVANPRATGVTLGASNLWNAGAPATGVNPGFDPGLADEVFLYTNGNPVTYFHDGTNWSDADGFPMNDIVIKEGTAAVIKRKHNSSFNWTVPAITIAP